jgi:hypothetical protein
MWAAIARQTEIKRPEISKEAMRRCTIGLANCVLDLTEAMKKPSLWERFQEWRFNRMMDEAYLLDRLRGN